MPGWYLDPSDPGAKRFWDGTAWTERKVANPPSPSERVGPLSRVESVADEASYPPDEVVLGVVREADAGDGDTVVRASEDEPSPGDDDGGFRRRLPGASLIERHLLTLDATHQTPTDPLAGEVGTWAEQARDAFSRALSIGSVTAWRDAVHCASRVADVVAAVEALREATRAVEEANRTLLEATGMAEEATRAAQAAAQAAETAGHVAQAAIRAAQLAAESALAATQRAEEVEAAVSKARTADTEQAWREAAKAVGAHVAASETAAASGS